MDGGANLGDCIFFEGEGAGAECVWGLVGGGQRGPVHLSSCQLDIVSLSSK